MSSSGSKEHEKKTKQLEKIVGKPLDQVEHKFWDTQPVPKLTDNIQKVKKKTQDIEKKTVREVRQECLPLPKGYEWYSFDVDSKEDMDKVYNLLLENYVEDDDSMFRFAYSIDFLKWALTPPKWSKDLHIAVRTTETHDFVGLITGVPINMIVHKKNIKMVEINFLCVHKGLRAKRLAPVLIKEVTRRTNLKGVWQAVYTAGIVIPTPIATTRYYHRSLNPRKLVPIKFSAIPPSLKKFSDPLGKLEQLNAVPKKPTAKGFRKMVRRDIDQVYPLLNDYLKKFPLHPHFTKKEFKHWMSNREGVIHSFVVENEEKKITDFGCFYHLPSTIIGHPTYKVLNAAYLFYYVPGSLSLKDLITQLLIVAKQMDFDVMNCLNIHDNLNFVEELRFGKGCGNLHYYLFNQKCEPMQPGQVGLTML